MTILLILLALVTCLVGIINSMLMSVTERVKEIGTLKCLGALDMFILQIYFIESSLQGVLGTVLGIVLGSIVALGTAFASYKSYVLAHFPVVGVLGAVLIALLIGALLSVLASIAPAYWAARKQPVEAMRVEE
jgi:ABC-type lipoprotein release transport system permease subunit